MLLKSGFQFSDANKTCKSTFPKVTTTTLAHVEPALSRQRQMCLVPYDYIRLAKYIFLGTIYYLLFSTLKEVFE